MINKRSSGSSRLNGFKYWLPVLFATIAWSHSGAANSRNAENGVIGSWAWSRSSDSASAKTENDSGFILARICGGEIKNSPLPSCGYAINLPKRCVHEGALYDFSYNVGRGWVEVATAQCIKRSDFSALLVTDGWFDSGDTRSTFLSDLMKENRVRIRAVHSDGDLFSTSFSLAGSSKAIRHTMEMQIDHLFGYLQDQ